MLKAVTRQATLVDAKVKAISETRGPTSGPISTAYFFDHFATPEDLAVMVTEQDFLEAHRELVPSVSAGELAHYERVRATFEGVKEENNQEKGAAVVVNGTGGGGGGAPAAAAAARLGLGAGRRTTSGASARSLSAKGKGKAAVVGKGKGKAVAGGSEDEYEYDGEGHGRGGDGELDGGYGPRDKGKGKEVAPPIVADAPFGDGAGSGDEGLYD
jgi:peroxin-6